MAGVVGAPAVMPGTTPVGEDAALLFSTLTLVELDDPDTVPTAREMIAARAARIACARSNTSRSTMTGCGAGCQTPRKVISPMQTRLRRTVRTAEADQGRPLFVRSPRPVRVRATAWEPRRLAAYRSKIERWIQVDCVPVRACNRSERQPVPLSLSELDGGVAVPMRRRFWTEAGLGVLSGITLAATLLWHDWIELIFVVEPDGGDGTFEWLVVALLASVTVGCFLVARTEWRRARQAALPPSDG
jgi:hypothetical protein